MRLRERERERERVEFQKTSEIVLRKLLQNRSAILDSYPKGERERNGENWRRERGHANAIKEARRMVGFI